MALPSKHTLLVVDDEPDVCESVHDLLRREFRVLQAHNAQDGLKILLEEDVHIVMTDQKMPRISGVELLANVRRRSPQAVRLLFTGYTDVDSIVAAINHGHVFQFLKKPWQPEELVESVRLAAAEYDRLAEGVEETVRLRSDVQRLVERVSNLEDEIQRLGGRLAQVTSPPTA